MTTYRWACIRCLDAGPADSPRHAVALIGLHEAYACPATAPDPVELERRMAWRRVLVERYGAVPYPREVS